MARGHRLKTVYVADQVMEIFFARDNSLRLPFHLARSFPSSGAAAGRRLPNTDHAQRLTEIRRLNDPNRIPSLPWTPRRVRAARCKNCGWPAAQPFVHRSIAV
jgi:hypothetical protein